MLEKSKQRYYKAKVKMFNDVIDVDTETGKGFDQILRKIEPFINRLSSKYFLMNYEFADVKNELNMIAIEGIYSYIPNDNLKLSSYLSTHIINKFYSRIKKDYVKKRDATLLKPSLIGENGKRFTRTTLPFEKVSYTDENSTYEKTTSDYHEIISGNNLSELFQKELILILEDKKIDSEIKNVIYLIYFENCNVHKACCILNLDQTAVSKKLKTMKKHPKFNYLLEKYIEI